MRVTIDCSPKELAALVRAATLPRETTVTMDTSRMNGILDSVAEAVESTVMSAADPEKELQYLRDIAEKTANNAVNGG